MMWQKSLATSRICRLCFKICLDLLSLCGGRRFAALEALGFWINDDFLDSILDYALDSAKLESSLDP